MSATNRIWRKNPRTRRRALHRVVMIVYDGSNPFELGVATELFGLRRPELPVDLVRLRALLAHPARSGCTRGFFTAHRRRAGSTPSTAPTPSSSPTGPTRRTTPARRSWRRSGAPPRGAPGWSASAPARSPSPRPGVLDGRRATTHWRWADAFTARFPQVRPRARRAVRRRRRQSSPRRAAPPPSTSASTSSAATTAPRSPQPSAAGWSSPRTATAASASSSSTRCPTSPDTSLAPAAGLGRRTPGPSPSTVADLAARAAVSPATLHRRFRAQLGTTPLAWLTERADHPGLPPHRARRGPPRRGRPRQRPRHGDQPAHPAAPPYGADPHGVPPPLRGGAMSSGPARGSGGRAGPGHNGPMSRRTSRPRQPRRPAGPAHHPRLALPLRPDRDVRGAAAADSLRQRRRPDLRGPDALPVRGLRRPGRGVPPAHLAPRDPAAGRRLRPRDALDAGWRSWRPPRAAPSTPRGPSPSAPTTPTTGAPTPSTSTAASSATRAPGSTRRRSSSTEAGPAVRPRKPFPTSAGAHVRSAHERGRSRSAVRRAGTILAR